MDSSTKFAPAERSKPIELKKQIRLIENANLAVTVLNAMPDIAAILNEQRQFVYANKVLLKFLDITQQNDLNGLRLGEVIGCVNAKKEDGGCGTSETCRYCGAVNAILTCNLLREKVSKECRISVENSGGIAAYDFKVTAAPFVFEGNFFIIVTLEDISDIKRRQVLERLFFHDILNLANGLKGIVDLIKEEPDSEEVSTYIEMAEQVSHELFDEIISQRSLVAAENGDLTVDCKEVFADNVLQETVNYLHLHKVAKEKFLAVANNAPHYLLNSDATLLKRVLINLAKNALEASSLGQTVTMNTYQTDDKACFTVHNSSCMTPKVQAQIFQRSFSTKGKNRGIGTYSIKLLTERYLKGTVSFTSNQEAGTMFTIVLPLNCQE